MNVYRNVHLWFTQRLARSPAHSALPKFLALLALVCLVVALAGLGVTVGRGQPLAVDILNIDRNVISTGGQISADSAGYSLSGTIGQPGVSYLMTNGVYNLRPGFWGDGFTRYIYIPAIMR
jgi:hypothetical protein